MDKHKIWDELKNEGSAHYKTGEAQMIDIYKAKGVLKPWALCEIAQHAIRNVDKVVVSIDDLRKILHYTELLIAEQTEVYEALRKKE